MSFDSQIEAKEHEAKLTDLFHKCPKCYGSGETFTGEPIYKDVINEDWLHQAGPTNQIVPKYISKLVGRRSAACDLCGGAGFTENKKTPIVRTEIIGWADS